MKSQRHAKILELIKNRPIETQEELLGLLREGGFPVTQATVSRDIKELRLVKTLTPDGSYYYTAHAPAEKGEMSNRLLVLLSESVEGIDSAGNITSIKCHTGMANALCEFLDDLHLEGVVGTLAGDNTIFLLMRDERHAQELVVQLRRMMSRS
ncbi:MAG TPA: arginine repressor [Candidatus Anaerotruncus excrementipullorum]|uniref:Arginine repressor n=1 Tax=Candidatus Anaerotruncus excrementipullorum TaxID=2838465 RepID=A0A9D1WPN4_9FIRM|nr:arginine repressor [Candidatus Anaerotruncus excrementipullorum]